MNITKGLIIDDPWIGYILDGSKTWEMASRNWTYRGWFALIRKGTGAVWGVARLVDVGPPMSTEEIVATHDKHRIPERMVRSGQVSKWTIPYKLADIRRLPRPVPYKHKFGAGPKVILDPGASAEIARQLGLAPASSDPTASPVSQVEIKVAKPQPSIAPTVHGFNTRPAMQAPSSPRSTETDATALSNGVGRLICEVEITAGNLDHNHFYIRPYLDRFPDDVIGGSNKSKMAKKEVTIDWGGPEPVKTDIDGEKHKFFRARGWIGRFYKLNGAKPGDKVRIEETAPYRYSVSLVR